MKSLNRRKVARSHSFNKSIYLLDIAKAYAVIMMILGHTLSQYLHIKYFDESNNIYNFWIFIRGLTAPIFLFASGVIYAKVSEKISLKKKVRNVILLFILAYGMHLPLFGASLEEFYRVDILHIFAVLFLFNLIIYSLPKNFRFISILFIFICLYLFQRLVELDHLNNISPFIRSYFTDEFHSYFSLTESAIFFYTGNILAFISNLFKVINIEMNNLNKQILFISRNSLYFYVLHLWLLYGHKVFFGVGTFLDFNSLNIFASVFLFFIVFLITYFLIYLSKKIKCYLF